MDPVENTLNQILPQFNLSPTQDLLESIEHAYNIQEERFKRNKYRAPGLTRTSVFLGAVIQNSQLNKITQEYGLDINALFKDIGLPEYSPPGFERTESLSYELHEQVINGINVYQEKYQKRGMIDTIGLVWGIINTGKGKFLDRIKNAGADPFQIAGAIEKTIEINEPEIPLEESSAKEEKEQAQEVKDDSKGNKQSKPKQEPLPDPPDPPPPSIQKYEIEKILHNDQWSETDLLDYKLYAKAIKSIIVQEDKKTKPPLTIAILAPWGQGKTTLMRYIENEFDSIRGTKQHKVSNETGSQTTIKKVLDWAKAPVSNFSKLQYPTVWFNPWKYQNSEQIWAGTAHAIITDLVAYLKPEDQENFWFNLNLKRIDLNSFKRNLYKSIVTDMLSWKLIIQSLLFLLIPIIALIIFARLNPGFDPIIKYLAGIVSLAGLTIPSVMKYISGLKSKLKDKFTEVLREPNYDKKLGFFHEVEDDMERVFDLIIDDEKPAVIFIDDLDRCSPDNVVEVIEAINLIINSNFSKKCYFVIGMDAQMVAASLDEKYSSLVGKFKNQESRYGSIGWYFLDKFIQLPIYLPVLSPNKKMELLSKLFKESKEESQTGPTTEDHTSTVVEFINDKTNLQKRTKIKELIKNNPGVRETYIEESIKLEKEDAHDIMEQLAKYATYLGSSPRSIKRFANMFRFNDTYQELRDLEDKKYANQDSLSKWIVLLLRYPQLVRFIQWEKEDKIINSKVPEDKANKIDEMISEFNIPKPIDIDDPNTLQNWKLKVESLELEGFDWLKEDDLIKILTKFNDEKSRLINAIECNVW